jgi:hypothetical protein
MLRNRTSLLNCSLSAPIVDVTQEAGASWLNKYTGVADFISAVDWMMNQTWGHAPTDLNILRGLKEAFNTTPITRLAGTYVHMSWYLPRSQSFALFEKVAD